MDKREDEHIKKHNEYEQWIREAEKIMKNTNENVERELEVIREKYQGQLNAKNDEIAKLKAEYEGKLLAKEEEIMRMIERYKQKLLERKAEIEDLKAEGGISEGLKSKPGKGVLIISQLDGEIVITHLITGKEN